MTTQLTDAEKAFLTMARMMDGAAEEDVHWLALEDVAAMLDPEAFPIVASTFEALTIERPELREHYDRAREAWEASQ